MTETSDLKASALKALEGMVQALTAEALAERVDAVARQSNKYDPHTRRALLIEAARRLRTG